MLLLSIPTREIGSGQNRTRPMQTLNSIWSLCERFSCLFFCESATFFFKIEHVKNHTSSTFSIIAHSRRVLPGAHAHRLGVAYRVAQRRRRRLAQLGRSGRGVADQQRPALHLRLHRHARQRVKLTRAHAQWTGSANNILRVRSRVRLRSVFAEPG